MNHLSKLLYLFTLVIVVLIGIISRAIFFNHIVLDKYLGDALYAVMIYLILRLLLPNKAITTITACSFVIVLLIEVFQLTGIPLDLRQSGNKIAYFISIALGTKFSVFDLLAYAIGIFLTVYIESYVRVSR